MHQVRPWLTGRLDFAPVIPFGGDADFPLRGGTVEYFLDRRAAVAVYGRRLHTVTLIVTRADGLPWPDATLGRDERARLQRAAVAARWAGLRARVRPRPRRAGPPRRAARRMTAARPLRGGRRYRRVKRIAVRQ